MGKPKQRSRLSVGFTAAKQAAQQILSSNAKEAIETKTNAGTCLIPNLHTADSPIDRLKALRSGKITKAKKKKQDFSNVTAVQVLDPGVSQSVSKISGAVGGSAKAKTKSSPSVTLDPQSFMTSTRKQMKLVVRSKKSRQLVKKEVFRKKVEDIKAEEKTKKEKKARQKTVIVGDMQPIFDALPSVPSLDDEIQNLINECNSTDTKGKQTKRKLSMKRRQEEIAQGLNYFAASLKKA